MIKYLVLLCVIVLPAFSQPLTLPTHINEVMGYLLKQEYREARHYIGKCRLSKIDSLFAVILVENAEMIDYESYAVNGRRFLLMCDSARIELQKTTEYKRTALQHYYYATIEGAVAVTRGKRNDFAGALTASNVSKKYYELVLASDSTFLPAQFGIALREFYSTTVTSKVGVGKKKLAASVSTMKQVISNESSMAHSLQPSLFWVYMDMKEYGEAEQLAQRFLRAHPNNTIMMRGLVKVQMVQGNSAESEKNAHYLMVIADKRSPKNWSDYFSGGVAVVTSMKQENRNADALKEITRLLALPLDATAQKLEWVKKHKKRLRELSEEINAKK